MELVYTVGQAYVLQTNKQQQATPNFPTLGIGQDFNYDFRVGRPYPVVIDHFILEDIPKPLAFEQ